MGKIFKPFRRLHSKETYSGMGIGLALCKRITEIHNGFIDVDKYKEGESIFYSIPTTEVAGNER